VIPFRFKNLLSFFASGQTSVSEISAIFILDGSLFTGSVTAAIGDLTVGLFEDVDLEDVIQEYHNTVAITFTNGSATIDLNAQFE